MSKHRFSAEEKCALWHAYGKKCFHCREPILFRETTIDHVLPERLLDKPEELRKIMANYGLGSDFSINDYCNWVPCHAHCNQEKGTTVYQNSPALINTLETIKRKGHKAKGEAQRLRKNLEAGDVLAKLQMTLEGGFLDKADVAKILLSIGAVPDVYEPIVVTFGLSIDETLTSGLERVGVPLDYPHLCNWLEKDLVYHWSALPSCVFYLPEASSRNGETLSVRLAFLQLDPEELNRSISPGWDILEVQYYSEVYGEAEWTRQRFREKLHKAPIIDDREFFELLLRGGVLVGFNQITTTDYRAIAISQDIIPYQSDSYYDLGMWKETLELAGLEDCEIEDALAKVDRDIV
jgi:hypothetical protein